MILNDDFEKPREFIPFGPYAKFGYGCIVIFLGSISAVVLGMMVFQAVNQRIGFTEALELFGFALVFSVLPIAIARIASNRKTERIVLDSETITLVSRGVPKIMDRYENVEALNVILGNYGDVGGYMVRFVSGKQFYFDKDIDHLKELTDLLEARTGKQFPASRI